MKNTQIKTCVCDHEFQDKRYGKKQRVMNRCPRTLGPDIWRCTVCKREQF